MEMKLKGLMIVGIVGIVMMCMVVQGEAAGMTCGKVASSVSGCIGYLRSAQGQVPQVCCNGIRSLNSQASTTVDRRIACNCLKAAAGSIEGINYGAAASLPSKCGVSVPYKISPSTDCAKVN
ncbi:non-specific lipid-transfer protein 1 [Cucumis sativus]|uniref:Non-specific lipid-transfer protein n=1 Tax=Cucumis sativus TaxID=3659 RepID=A0A0A0LF44_CUCSA|nr:non-specific lipid-transfer protein 1 [Cucumis sativus]KGN58696.1 hypothetical protein Csa_001468 [Cucumis sativus]